MIDLNSTNLPGVVKKWLLNCGALECKLFSKVHITQKAYMKQKPSQNKWFFATAKQSSSIDFPAFEWDVKLKMNPLMWVKGRDTFKNGKGHMQIKLFSLFNVVNATGQKIDEGTMQRYLGEMVWMPALALSQHISWEEIDNRSARATMSYMETTCSGVFYFNDQGDFIKFVAMRFRGGDEDSKRYEWVLIVTDYAVFEGVRIPSKMNATWILDDRPWTWLKLEITNLLLE